MGKIAFLFPGQGAQSVGMGRQLLESLSAAKSLFAAASDLLGYDLISICQQGPAERLNSTIYSQPALFVTSLAALEMVRATNPEWIEHVQAAAGLSLGEYTALVFAGALSFEDGLRLVQARGAAMQAAADESAGGMTAVLGLDEDQVRAVCDAARLDDEVLQVANLLCPGNIALSGHRTSLERVVEAADRAGAMRTIPLAVAGAFHTELMRSAADRLSSALAQARFSDARIPIVSNVDALPHQHAADFPPLLLQQLCAPVLWHRSMEYLIADGFDTFYEIGPGRVLKGLMKRINRKMACESVID